MPNYRRALVPGGSFFFTVVTYRRLPIFDNQTAIALLGGVMRQCLLNWPCQINAIVVSPNHLHTIWPLPTEDANYSRRWGWLKKEFTQRWLEMGGPDRTVTTGKSQQRRRGVWQPRFWEHALRDEDDFERHFDYIHWNPVKHGHVECPFQWPHSSFHRYVRAGVYDQNWGCALEAASRFATIEDTVGEPN